MPCLILWDDNDDDDDGWVKKDHGSSSFVKEGLNLKGFFSSIEQSLKCK
jgi:hypothetical protein